MQVVKLIKEDWPIYSVTVSNSLLLKSFITKVLEYYIKPFSSYALLCVP